MTLLTPLGLLGLLGVVGLIIIYIIKPNFQQKFISSTHIWKLSLKYRKKKIPTSKLRNLLLILCQIVFLTACAAILAQPNKVLRSMIQEPEVIMIIDSSASMRTEMDGKSRYVRAIEEARLQAADVFDENGYVTVIIADETPSYLMSVRMRANYRVSLDAALKELTEGETQCSYAVSNVDEAIGLCESVVLENPNAKVYLYSDNEYGYVPKTVTYVNVSDEMEWNAAVLDAKTEYQENKYSFLIDVACYGVDAQLDLELKIEGANAMDDSDAGSTVTYVLPIICVNGETTQALFVSKEIYLQNEELYEELYGASLYVIPEGNGITTYKAIHATLKDASGDDLADSLPGDDTFVIYGGMKPVIKVQYFSTTPNSFWPAAIRQLRNVMNDRWDIQYTEVKQGTLPETSGFDLYIFEHVVPDKLPEDGVLWLIGLQEVAADTGIKINNMPIQTQNSAGEPLVAASTSPILNNISAESITVSMFFQLMLDDTYEPLLLMEEIPMLAVRNDEQQKIMVTAFNMHFTNLAILVEFPMLVYNMFNYFFPTTVVGNAFNVYEEVQLNCMSDSLEVLGYNYHEIFKTFPASFVVSNPGTYTIKQTNFVGREFRENIYVRMPKEESDIFKSGETVADLYVVIDKDVFYEDFLFYIAIILVAVAFVEWWLRGQKGV